MRLFQGQRQPVKAVAFAPDGRHLAAPDGRSGLVVYDVAAGRLRHRIPLSRGPADLLAFLPDGRLAVAAGEDMGLYLDPLWAGTAVGFHPNQVDGPVTSLTVSPDGSRLFATAVRLHCWDMSGNGPRPGWVVRIEAPGLFWSAAVAPDGERLAVSADPWYRPVELALYGAKTGERLSPPLCDYFLRGGPLA